MSRPRSTVALTSASAAAVLALAAGIASSASAAPPPTGEGTGGISLTQVGSFQRPIHADDAPGTKANLYVAEQEGVIRVLSGTTVLPTPFLDIQDAVKCCGEEGLLSIAFHPQYRKNRLFYVYYTNVGGDNTIAEFKRAKKPKRRFEAVRGSGREVLTIPHPTFGNHNGGQIQFGPDGLLYLATGDGGGGGDPDRNAQNPESLLGKMLRIDPRPACGKKRFLKRKGKKKRRRNPACASSKGLISAGAYAVPADNPYVGTAGRDEIYSIGLRNPFRFSFDAASGDLVLGDVGQGCIEEINFLQRGAARGANFGWSRWEGTHLFDASRAAPGAIFPVHQYDNRNAGPACPNLNNGFEGVSVIPGYVVRDERLTQQYGRLLYSDASNDQIRSILVSPGGSADDQSTGTDMPGSGQPFAFAEGFGRQLFVLSGGGPVYRLDP